MARIAFICQPFDLVLPPEQTSIGIWTYEVARRLAAENDVRVYARHPRNLDRGAVPEFMEFVPCAPMRLWSGGSRWWRRVRPHSEPLFARRIYAFDFVARLTARLRRFQPDVVHLQNFPQFAGRLRRALPETPIVLHMHCDWLAELDAGAMARSVAAVDLVAGCSLHVVERARARLGGGDVPYAVLPNGTSVEPVEEDPGRRGGRNVLFVGRVSPEKGVHTILEAWPRVLDACPDARLDIVGPAASTPQEFLVDLSTEPRVRSLARFYPGGDTLAASYEAALRALIPEGARHTVRFSGHLPQALIAGRLREADLLVNPSLSESFGMSLIEAIGAGIPVVATRVGGMPEIILSVGSGSLVEADDPEALAEAMIASLAAPRLASEAQKLASRRVGELYSWSRIACRTSELHEQASRRRERRSCPSAAAGIR